MLTLRFARRPRPRLCSVAVLAFIASFAPAGALGEQASDPGSTPAGQLDVGDNFSCAIIAGGQVKCWGYGADGELGVPGQVEIGVTNTPAAVPAIDLGSGFTAKAISSGDYHTCAIRNPDNSVVCWGYGANGRLGYGNQTDVGDNETPGSAGAVSLPAPPGQTAPQSATAITAGGGHTCAILTDPVPITATTSTSNVACWGYGFNGELGIGDRPITTGDTATDTPNLEPAVDLGGHLATAISAGSSHTCALLDNGQISCWGYGGNGRLGYGTMLQNSVYSPGDSTAVPPAVSTVALPGTDTATAISAGGAQTCAIVTGGHVYCWGFGFSGQLGYGNQNDVGDNNNDTLPTLPGPVNLGPGNTAVAISTGQAHTCAILQNGQVECWGYGADGRLGYGGTIDVGEASTDEPGQVGPVNLGAGNTAVAISAGGMHTCATLASGHVLCWGYGGDGQLGYCSGSDVGDTPADTPNTVGPVNLVAGDGGEQCASGSPPPPAAPTNSSPPTISGPAAVGDTLTEQHGTWSPAPTAYSYQWERCDGTGASCADVSGATGPTFTLVKADIGSTFRVRETVSAGGASAAATSAPTAPVKAKRPTVNAEAARAHRFRSCLAAVQAGTGHLRALTHRGSARQRRRARHRLARRLAAGRAACVKRWGHTPGRVIDLTARATSRNALKLSFVAPGTRGYDPPAAVAYLVHQSISPIRTNRAFAGAPVLCRGACRFKVTVVGTTINLTVTGLRPGTVYYYSVAALDNVTGRVGPRSGTVKVRTRG